MRETHAEARETMETHSQSSWKENSGVPGSIDLYSSCSNEILQTPIWRAWSAECDIAVSNDRILRERYSIAIFAMEWGSDVAASSRAGGQCGENWRKITKSGIAGLCEVRIAGQCQTITHARSNRLMRRGAGPQTPATP